MILDFILGTGSTLCEPDCTLTTGDTCDAACHGTNNCFFYSDDNGDASAICSGKGKDFRLAFNSTHDIQCCTGEPYLQQTLQATTTIPEAINVIRVIRNVWYEGKLVRLVVDVFN